MAFRFFCCAKNRHLEERSAKRVKKKDINEKKGK